MRNLDVGSLGMLQVVKRVWVSVAALLLAWLISFTPLHMRLSSWVRDHQQEFISAELYFTDTVVLDIDDASLRELEPHFGPWPFKRDVYALLLDYLTEHGATTVVFDLLFAESRQNDETLRQAVMKNKNAIFVAAAPARKMPISKAERAVLRQLSWKGGAAVPSTPLEAILLPHTELLGTAGDVVKIGVVTAASDPDGILRSLPLLYRVEEALLPSLSLRILTSEENEPQVSFDSGTNEISVGNYHWPTAQDGTIQLYFPKNANSILALPFSDVAEAALGIKKTEEGGFFRGKTVFIGSTAYLSDRVNTPRGDMAGTYVLAIAHETMKQGLVLRPDKTAWNALMVVLALIPGAVLGLRNRFLLQDILLLPFLGGASLFIFSLGLLGVANQQSNLLFPLEILILSTILNVFHSQLIAKRQNQLLAERNLTLSQVAHTDVLTGLPNRRAFLEAYRKEMDRVGRYGGELPTIAIMDLDHFKKVNDTYGHDVGDEVLKVFSQVLTSTLRTTDIAGRWGGEEFTVLLTSTSQQNTLLVLDRVRLATSEQRFAAPAEKLLVTVSIGVVVVEEIDDTAEQTIKKADAALYEAKESGRNRVCLYHGV